MKKLSDRAFSSSAGTSYDLNDLFFHLALILRRRECTDRAGVIPGCSGGCSRGGKNGLCAFLGKEKFQPWEIVRGSCPFEGRKCQDCAGYFLYHQSHMSSIANIKKIERAVESTCLLSAKLERFNTPMLSSKLYNMFVEAYPRAYASLDLRWGKRRPRNP